MTVGSCRAYFQLNGIEAGDLVSGVRAFKLNFGEDATGILSTTNYTNLTNSVYDLQGRKVLSERTVRSTSGRSQGENCQLSTVNLKKGVYIYKGKKVVIK